MKIPPLSILYIMCLPAFFQSKAAEESQAACLPPTKERQLTYGAGGYGFTNAFVWSPNSEWIVYDRRKVLPEADSHRIEQVNIHSGEIITLYESNDEAACLLPYYHPKEQLISFVMGPAYPTTDWSYGFSKRRGALLDARKPRVIRPIDAMNYAPPFTPGALRGGSHIHIFSPQGDWISFTYEDEVLSKLAGTTAPHDKNQRNIGVSIPGKPVSVNRNHPRNHDGDYFSVLVTQTNNNPKPGSDEITRAFEESWIGQNGYLRLDGKRQTRAIAFQGRVIASDGNSHAEAFLVDLPPYLSKPGEAPLEGSETRRPAPPDGVKQRRLTFTSNRKYPGIVQSPRHWLHSSPDGAQIAFLMKDDEGLVQLWTVSPNGGPPKQISRHPWSIDSAFTWSPDGRYIAHTMDCSIFVTEVTSGRGVRLTARDTQTPPMNETCVFSPEGKHIAYLKYLPEGEQSYTKIFIIKLPVIF